MLEQSPQDSLNGPAWDLSGEYTSSDAPELHADLARVQTLLDAMEAHNAGFDGEQQVQTAKDLFVLAQEASMLLQNVGTYGRCLLSVDSRDEAAQALLGRLKNYNKRYAALYEPLSQFTVLATDAEIDAYLDDPRTGASAFVVRHARQRRHELLSVTEEQLVSGLSQDGIHAWGALYGQLSGTIRCQVDIDGESTSMGLAQAAAKMSGSRANEREAAWRATNAAWSQHEETCAAALNAIAGWRLELAARRSAISPVHFLDAPAHASRIGRHTLETLLGVAAEYRPLAQRAAKLQARALGQDHLGPWDQRAPAPTHADRGSSDEVPFSTAIEQIARAYASVDPSMGEFVQMMANNRWIEGSVGPNKRPGAYCTGFSKSRESRVYMTYDGSPGEVITLAHELGHAYHSWVMRDLPLVQTSYGMSLAETASTFGETLVRDALTEQATSDQGRLDMMWEEMSALVAFLLNIPARFMFEERLYEARSERPLRPDELRDLMSQAWVECYGDAIGEPDPMFWASKLHFYISGLSFYNFPYLFGYLFSNGIYAHRQSAHRQSAHRQSDPATFFPRFNALLRDTGRMTAEDLAMTHLQVDLSTPEYWRTTLNDIALRVDAFEQLLDDMAIGR